MLKMRFVPVKGRVQVQTCAHLCSNATVMLRSLRVDLRPGCARSYTRLSQ